MTKLTVLAVGGMLIGFALSSQAANFYWNGSVDNSWHDNDNWQDSGGNPVAVYPGQLGSQTDAPWITTAGANVNLSQTVNLIVDDGTIYTDSNAQIYVGSTTAGTPATLNISADVTASILLVGDVSDAAHGVVHHTSGSLAARTFGIGTKGSGEYHFGSADENTAPSADFGFGLNPVTYNWRSRLRPEAGNTALLSLSGYGEFKGLRLEAETAGEKEIRVQGGNLDINWSVADHSTRFGNATTYTAIIDDTGISTWNANAIRFVGTENLNFKLTLDESFTFVKDQKFTILSANKFFNSANTENAGTFSNVAHEDVIDVGGYKFLAEYYYGSGKKTFTLTAIAKPSLGTVILVI